MSYLPIIPYGNETLKTLTFSSSSGALPIVTITGDVILRFIAVCKTGLASGAGGSISLGVSGNTAILNPLTLATDLLENELWFDASPDTTFDTLTNAMKDFVVSNGQDIILTCSDVIDSGAIDFYFFWTPLSANASVVVA
jgi:hypothetical protein